MILAFKTEWKYYFWIRNYECIYVFLTVSLLISIINDFPIICQ